MQPVPMQNIFVKLKGVLHPHRWLAIGNLFVYRLVLALIVNFVNRKRALRKIKAVREVVILTEETSGCTYIEFLI